MEEMHTESGKTTDHTFTSRGIARLGERLSTLINGEPYKSFAKKCDMSDKAIRDYVSGRTYPSLDRIAHIAEVTGCSFEWLATGYDFTETAPMAEEMVNIPPSDKQQKAWLEILERMTPTERDAVLNNVFRQGINALLNQHQMPGREDTVSGLSADEALVGRMYASLTPDERKSFLVSLIDEEQKETNRRVGDKSKAS